MKQTYFGQKCIIYNKETKKLLILERNNYKKDDLEGEGYFDLPGGSVEWQEDSKISIIREAKEETNFEIKEPQIIDLLSIPVNKNKDFFIFALYFCDNFEGTIKLSFEHKNYKWISINEIDKYTFRISVKRVLNIIKKYIKNIEN